MFVTIVTADKEPGLSGRPCGACSRSMISGAVAGKVSDCGSDLGHHLASGGAGPETPARVAKVKDGPVLEMVRTRGSGGALLCCLLERFSNQLIHR